MFRSLVTAGSPKGCSS